MKRKNGGNSLPDGKSFLFSVDGILCLVRFFFCRPFPSLSPPYKKTIRPQSGNVLALLFGAVALTGVLAATSMEIIIGPVQTITHVTQKNMADTQMMTNAKLVVMEAATQPANRDSDGDGYIEPIEYVPNGTGGCNMTFTGGGCLPSTMGAALTDPFGRSYAYCVWDHGSADNGHTDASPSSPYRLQGEDNQTHPVIAIISSGRDQSFQTRCAAFDGSGDEGVVRTVGSDDFVFTYTYAEATAASAGLWQLKSGDPDTAEIDKDIEIKNASSAVTASIDRSTGVGDFLGITTDVIAAKTGNVVDIDGHIHLDVPGSFSIIYMGADFGSDKDLGLHYGGNTSAENQLRFGRYADNRGAWEANPVVFDMDAPTHTLVVAESGNVGIGTASPHSSASLDLLATDKGFLPPRLSESQRDSISSPAEGLIVYNTDTKMPEFWDGSDWVAMAGGGGSSNLGNSSSSPAASCNAIKQANSSASDGTYWVNGGSGNAYEVYCDMTTGGGGWTLIAKYSNTDTTNWMNNNSWWYSRTSEAGAPTEPTSNVDAISQSFWTVSGTELRITRSDNHRATLFETTNNCLSGQNFRQMFQSLGTFSSSFPGDSVRKTCAGSLSGNYSSTSGFQYATCSSDIGAANSISFIAQWGSGDGAVIMIGGGGGSCGRADHGIGVTESNDGGITTDAGADDFGNNGTDQSDSYALLLWVK
jgi:hypothetical protein